jgi:hypothetical protein
MPIAKGSSVPNRIAAATLLAGSAASAISSGESIAARRSGRKRAT